MELTSAGLQSALTDDVSSLLEHLGASLPSALWGPSKTFSAFLMSHPTNYTNY